MLRKANETKRQIIESLNKRLMNESESLDSRIESIVKKTNRSFPN
jgi:predicted oxidoreductase (fatty acid repression mutant protein)